MAETEYRWEGLDELEKKLAELIERRYPEEFEAMVLQIAYELQGRVKERTPIGPTGRLADSWTVGPIKKSGDTYVIEVYTNVEYAEPVEHGHRTRGGGGFVPGRHMMEISLAEVEHRLPGYLRDWLARMLATLEL